VNWEAVRRAGRSQVVHVHTGSWRDGDGMLWTPNTLVPISIPFLKIPEQTFMLISEVTYLLHEHGTHAELVLMLSDAFKPEPTILPAFAGRRNRRAERIMSSYIERTARRVMSALARGLVKLRQLTPS